MLRAWSDHLSVFDIEVNDWESANMPKLESFQVTEQTGPASCSLPIWTLPGPAEFQPSLSLSYNSQGVDGTVAPVTQASWVGMCWSLDTGAITRNTHGTTNEMNAIPSPWRSTT